MMDAAKNEGYVAGVLSLLAAAIFILFAVNSGFDFTGQVVTVIGAR